MPQSVQRWSFQRPIPEHFLLSSPSIKVTVLARPSHKSVHDDGKILTGHINASFLDLDVADKLAQPTF